MPLPNPLISPSTPAASLIEAAKCTIEDSKRLKKLSDVCKKCDEVLKEE